MIPDALVSILWWLFAVLIAGLLGYAVCELKTRRPSIPREDRERVLELVRPAVVDGECLGCGGRELPWSPPILAHGPFCPEADRVNQIRRLLQL